MKKKRLFGLLLLAPLGLLAGCGGTATLSFLPNWFYENSVENPTGKSETLEYKVTFDAAQSETVNLAYDNGRYVTKLSAENVGAVQAYRYDTQFNITGRYSLGEEQGEQFEDSMTSSVWFMRAENDLQPIKSEKKVRATVPYTEPGSSAWYTTFEFTYTVNYAADLSTADYSLEITAPESQKKRSSQGTIKLGMDETFLDNEEITIALRGLNLTSASAAIPFVTIDPQTRRTVTVNPSTELQKIALPFTCNGEQITDSIDVVQVSCAYNADQPGPTRKFYYAARTDENSKKYRSVLLRFENPVMYSLGTMIYTLETATFNDR